MSDGAWLGVTFFRRAAALLGEHGTLGLIATKTIAQGDTRMTGLLPLLRAGWQIYDSIGPMPWPGTAGVSVCSVHAAQGGVRELCIPKLNGVRVESINSRLRPKPERPDPIPIGENADAIFQGSIALGMGFTLTPAQRDALLHVDSRNGERIFPYIGGEEVSTNPLHEFDRYVINFGNMSLEQAERWPALVAIVRDLVKPERDRQADNADGRRRKQFWWQFGRETPALARAIAPLERCLVTLFTAKYMTFSFQPTNRIYANSLWVLPLACFCHFAVLQSRQHEAWARLLSSSLEDRLRYSASDCFETFPFPQPDPRTVIPELESIGERLYEARAKYMVDTNQGLTKTYNALKDPVCDDPRILELRSLHEEMDRAVLAAYRWDVPVPPYCPKSDADRAAIQAFEDEVIDRLYLLNAERAREEQRLGLGGKKKKAASEDREDATDADAAAPTPTKKGGKKKGDVGGGGQGDLF